VGEGTSADIHIFSHAANAAGPGNNTTTGNHPSLTTQIITGPSGLRLIIEPLSGGYTAGLYDILGTKKAFMPVSESSQNSLPLQGIAGGRYILKIETDKKSLQKMISIAR
jgi:hypothetical protein